MSRDRERTKSRCWLPPPRTCSQLPVPGHEITALSLWKRLLPPLHGHPLLPTYIDLRPVCRLARLPPAACLCQLGSPSFVREPPKIMLPEISIKRDSVRAGIRLNLSSYSTRGRKETFRAGERACPGFEMTHVYRAVWWLPHPFSLFSLRLPFSLTLFNTAILSFPFHLAFTHTFSCPIRCHRTESGRPNGISSYTVYTISPLCFCRDLGQRSSRKAKGKERNVRPSNT